MATVSQGSMQKDHVALWLLSSAPYRNVIPNARPAAYAGSALLPVSSSPLYPPRPPASGTHTHPPALRCAALQGQDVTAILLAVAPVKMMDAGLPRGSLKGTTVTTVPAVICKERAGMRAWVGVQRCVLVMSHSRLSRTRHSVSTHYEDVPFSRSGQSGRCAACYTWVGKVVGAATVLVPAEALTRPMGHLASWPSLCRGMQKMDECAHVCVAGRILTHGVPCNVAAHSDEVGLDCVPTHLAQPAQLGVRLGVNVADTHRAPCAHGRLRVRW